MSATAAVPRLAGRPAGPDGLLPRLAPTLVAAVLAAIYVIVSPPSLDLAAHLLRAKLFSAEGFGLWNNWWYGGHHTPGYSVLFPPLAAVLTPQVVGALSNVVLAALFESLARARFGPTAWLGSLWFGAATALDLFTGRLTFAFGLMFAMATALALQRRRDGLAALLAVVTALASPVAALFAAVAAAACAVGRTPAAPDASAGAAVAARVPPVLVAGAALLPVLILAVLFPEGGTEPFTVATLWPILLIGAVLLVALPRSEVTLRAGVVIYLAGCLGSYAIPTAVGSNVARLAPLFAGPLAALLWWPRRKAWLALVALPLLYIQWQAPVRDVKTSWGDPSVNASYDTPLLRFLDRQPGMPFRIEIPFTKFHWEAYQVAPRFPLARGWERQLDIKDNHLFYDHTLSAATYRTWLQGLAVHYVAVARSNVDYSAQAELALINRGLPYLHLVMRTRDWRVYAVQDPAPLAQGAATATAIGPNSVSLRVTRPGRAYVRVRFSPYWALSGTPGCVENDGGFTAVTVRRPGPARLVIRFSLARVGSRRPRCT